MTGTETKDCWGWIGDEDEDIGFNKVSVGSETLGKPETSQQNASS